MSNNKSRMQHILLIGGICIFALFPLCSFQVRTTEFAIIESFGKFVPVDDPGLHWKWPWPFQKVRKLNKTLQVHQIQFAENYTADRQNNITLTYFISWKIDNPEVFLNNNLGSIDKAKNRLNKIISSAQGSVIRRHPFSHFVSPDPEQQQFDRIEKDILDEVKNEAISKYGIEITGVHIERIALPPDVTTSVLERMKAERQNKAEKIIQEGNRQASILQSTATRKMNEGIVSAQAKAKQIRSEGDIAAAKHYQAFNKDPEFALFLQQIKALESITKMKTTLIIDDKGQPFSMFKKEFDKK